MLGEVVPGEPGLVGHADEVEPVLEQLLRRGARDPLDVIEDAERRCCHCSLPGLASPDRSMESTTVSYSASPDGEPTGGRSTLASAGPVGHSEVGDVSRPLPARTDG